MRKTFSIAADHPPKAGLTISTPLIQETGAIATAFSLGSETDISPETYEQTILYLGLSGDGDFLLGDKKKVNPIAANDLLIVNPDTLCGVET